ncbi:MAG: HAMP domain-containing sensor histidine kinase [Candidatus Aenigmatarchaeota archaeon]
MNDKELIEQLKNLSIQKEKLNQNIIEKIDKILTQSNKISDEFLHDFKSLISSLKSALEGLSIVETETAKIYLQHIISQSIAEIIESIENLIIECNLKNNEKIEIVNLSEIINSTLNEFYPLILEKNLEITKELNNVTMRVNHCQIKRILSNLLLNAIKFNKQNGKIIISVKEFNDKVEIIIKDTGIGISPEIKQKIFKEKVREYNSIPGSGMGLLIVKKIIDNLGGTIKVESEKNQGTTFYINLPKQFVENE